MPLTLPYENLSYGQLRISCHQCFSDLTHLSNLCAKDTPPTQGRGHGLIQRSSVHDGFKMLPGESFDMLDERFHKILNDLASLNHVLSPKEKNVRLLRSLPTEWYTKATAKEEGRNLENYTVQGLLDELKTYEHELKKKKEEQVTPFPTALMTTPRVPSTCPYPKVEKYGERERNEKKKKAMVAAESDKSSSSSSDEEALVCMERRAEKSNHEDRWTMSEDDTLCLMAKDDANQEFKKMMEDFKEINLKHSSLTEENKLLSEENLKLTEGRRSQLNEITQLKAENESLSEKVKSLNKELGILMSKEAVDKLLETTKHKGREGLGFDPSSSKRKGRTTFIPPKPTAKPNKQKGKEKEKPTEVPKKEVAKYPGVWYLDSGCSRHMTGDASLLSNLIPYDGPRVTFGGSNDFGLTKGLGNLVYKGLTIQAVSYVEGLNYNLLSISQFCDKGYSLEFCKDMASLKNISTNEVILTGKRIRNIYEKLEAKCSSPTFFQSYLEMMAAQELSEFLQMEIRLKFEEEVLEFYRNGEVKTAHSKKDPQRTFPVIKSTVGVKGKKYEARYWLYYLSSKGENRANASATAEESSSDNVPLIHMAKTAKRKQVVSPSISIEAPQNLALAKEPAEETSAQNRSPQQLEEEIPQVQSLPTSSTQPRMDDADNQFWQLYYDWRGWKVGNSAEQLMDWDQQLKNEKIIKKCLGIPVNHSCEEILDDYRVWQRNHEDLHLEYLANSPISEFEVDDEDPSVYKPVFSKATEEQVVLTSEAQAVLEATVEDFQTSPEASPAFETETSPALQETSHASEMVLTEAVQEKAASPPPEKNQKTAEEEEFQQLIQSQALEILTTPCEISNPTETEIPEKLAEILEQSTFPETNEEEQAVEVQRNSGEHHPLIRQEIEQMEAKYTKLIEKSEEKHNTDLKEISKSVHKTLEIISLLSETHSKEIRKNSAQHLSSSELDGIEFIGTVVDHFSNDAQSEERRENLRCIKELCGNMKGISEVAGSSKRKRN
ncbi:unnamed protein product [Cuscuta campestris]|uniref:Retrovirus-related Pol polyprotein from transposon TNT 1-94-like beta-barrel domain-containing protein n=1 Tax=Cuscuta campestris TaxID=132261 RepID=A0A484ND52_9ASTE|nr:unnamed protein product [Cuscuta campestris]